MQSILWCAWPPPGRSSTLKIACGSNIDDIWGNTTFVAIYIFLENSITIDSLKFFLRVVVYASALHQKNFIKIGHRMWKIRLFQPSSPIFLMLASTVKRIAQPDVVGHLLFYICNQYIYRSQDAIHLMVCLASTGKEFDGENSLRVEY